MPPSSAMHTLGELFAGLPKVEYVGCDAATAYGDLAVDSRLVGPQSVFLALRGDSVDGHSFIAAVIRKGVRAVVLERGRAPAPACPHIWLDSTRDLAGTIAARHFGRPGDELELVGITGTNGKTTCAHLVSSILAESGAKHFRLGTTGNWLVDHHATAKYTTPPPLELHAALRDALDRGARFGVMEVSSHALAQGRVDGLRFDVIGLTSFSRDHLDFHSDLEGYFTAKCELAQTHIRQTRNRPALAIAHASVGSYAERFLDIARDRGAQTLLCTREGFDGHALAPGHARAFHARAWSSHAGGMSVTIESDTGLLQLESPLVGDYNLENLMLSVAACRHLGIEDARVQNAVRGARGAPGRLERVDADPGSRTALGRPRVLVDYAHTPDAVARALAVIRPTTRGKIYIVLGCGGDRDRRKRPMMAQAALEGADHLIATSDNPRNENPDAILDEMLEAVPKANERVTRISDRARAIAHGIRLAGPADTLLIAGKGHEDYQIIGADTIHFDDREVARACLNDEVTNP